MLLTIQKGYELLANYGCFAPKVAQRQLRHADARVTLNIYAHLVEGKHREAVEKLASFLLPSGPNEEEAPLRIQ